jgi:hypothetical protein
VKPLRGTYLIGVLIRGAFMYSALMVLLAGYVVFEMITGILDVNLPVSTSYPPHPSLAITGVMVTVTHPTIFMITTLGVSHILTCLVGAGVAVVIGLVCRRLRAGTPFVAVAVRMLVWAAIIVAVGLTASDILQQFGQNAVTSQADAIRRYGDLQLTSGQWGLNPVPLFFALVLIAVAGAFRYGERLQADTEGLV